MPVVDACFRVNNAGACRVRQIGVGPVGKEKKNIVLEIACSRSLNGILTGIGYRKRQHGSLELGVNVLGNWSHNALASPIAIFIWLYGSLLDVWPEYLSVLKFDVTATFAVPVKSNGKTDIKPGMKNGHGPSVYDNLVIIGRKFSGTGLGITACELPSMTKARNKEKKRPGFICAFCVTVASWHVAKRLLKNLRCPESFVTAGGNCLLQIGYFFSSNPNRMFTSNLLKPAFS